MNHVALVGDSTIDNILWVKKVERSVPGVLTEELPNWKITNYAADGYTTTNVLQGATPFISSHIRKQINDPFPNENFFAPLEELEILHQSNPISHLVLSVGGNDVRVILGSISKIFTVIPAFASNYNLIVERLLQITPNLIIMTQYRPSLYQDSHYGVYRSLQSIPIPFVGADGVSRINFLMNTMYKLVFPMAVKHRIPVVDLSNTFEPRYTKLFVSQIEPSGLGSQLIGHLIAHVLKNHDFEGPSVVYSAQPKNYDLVNSKVVISKVDSVINNNNWSVVDDASVLTKENLAKWQDEVEQEEASEEEELSGEYATEIRSLNSMGFSNLQKNLQLLEEYDGNVNAVVDRLLNDI